MNMKMKYIYLITALTNITPNIFTEMRLTLVNETPYEFNVSYTTETGGSLFSGYKYTGEPIRMFPNAQHTFYHAGEVKGSDMGITPIDPKTLLPLSYQKPNLINKTINEIYLEGAQKEAYTLEWLQRQVWQGGDRWNWTLWIKERNRPLTKEEFKAYSSQKNK